MEKIGVLAFHYCSKNGSEKIFLNKNYCDAIYASGALPVIIPITENLNQIKSYILSIDRLLLPGGGDINPLILNEEPLASVNEVSLQRDRFEIACINCCLKHKKPMMGICRGMQVINVAMGGGLIQDIKTQCNSKLCHMQSELNPSEPCHSITVLTDTWLFDIFGEHTAVNSYHHQAISTPAKDLIATAYSTDEICEAVESKKHRIIAVQWHPEKMYLTDTAQKRLFEKFLSI